MITTYYEIHILFCNWFRSKIDPYLRTNFGFNSIGNSSSICLFYLRLVPRYSSWFVSQKRQNKGKIWFDSIFKLGFKEYTFILFSWNGCCLVYYICWNISFLRLSPFLFPPHMESSKFLSKSFFFPIYFNPPFQQKICIFGSFWGHP